MKIFAKRHQHEWSKWEIEDRYALTRTLPWGQTGERKDVVGHLFIQERRCKTCGKTEIDKQEVTI